jgi:hypothetical protein
VAGGFRLPICELLKIFVMVMAQNGFFVDKNVLKPVSATQFDLSDSRPPSRRVVRVGKTLRHLFPDRRVVFKFYFSLCNIEVIEVSDFGVSPSRKSIFCPAPEIFRAIFARHVLCLLGKLRAKISENRHS